MSEQHPSWLWSVFRFVVAKRWWVVAICAILLGPSVYYAIKVPQDNSIDRLIVQSDPDYIAARDFEKVFGAAEYVVLLAEADDPFSPAVLGRLSAVEGELGKLPQVAVNSALSVYRRSKAGFEATPEQAAAFKKFVTGTNLFSNQHLYGEHFLAIPLVLTVKGTDERAALLDRVDAVIADLEQHPAPLSRLRKVGQPYVNAYLDKDTRATGIRYFPLFFLFVTVLCVALYRSWRTLVAFIITLGMSAAMTVGFVGITGGVFTIVSSLVPMTILITCTATLVYLQSRFVDRPPDRAVDDHQIFALCNKFLACTASIFAAAVGFAALAVSKIRPIREMGLWVAVGLVFTWLLVFTLFPALQKLLRTPTTSSDQHGSNRWFISIANFVPGFSYRFRWVLVPAAIFMCGMGTVALLGLPGGLISPMKLETNAVDYINHDAQIYKDTKELEKNLGGLAVTNMWLVGPQGSISKPETLRGLIDLQDSLQKDPHIGSSASVVTILRTLRYMGGKGDVLPTDDDSLEKLTDDLESFLPREQMLQSFVDKTNLGQTQFSVITRTEDYEGFVELTKVLTQLWAGSVARHPALKEFKMRPVGLAPLQAKISHHMVPTLVESFGLTVAIIFGTFLLVFRSGIARLMAMIPSFFAILVMFLVMRLTGVALNVATILIASTVLGTSENDQIHFFYHFGEKRKDGTVEESLRHTMLISGRAIFYATLINAGGFLAFALAKLPPVRQFGLLSSLAFVLSMIADFTALPAALWLLYRSKPDALTPPGAAVASSSPPARPALPASGSPPSA